MMFSFSQAIKRVRRATIPWLITSLVLIRIANHYYPLWDGSDLLNLFVSWTVPYVAGTIIAVIGLVLGLIAVYKAFDRKVKSKFNLVTTIIHEVQVDVGTLRNKLGKNNPALDQVDALLRHAAYALELDVKLWEIRDIIQMFIPTAGIEYEQESGNLVLIYPSSDPSKPLFFKKSFPLG